MPPPRPGRPDRPAALAGAAAAPPTGSQRREPVDGRAGSSGRRLDVARDGAGAIVYRKHDGGVPHVFLARLRAAPSSRRGAWTPASPTRRRATSRSRRPTAAGWPTSGSPAAALRGAGGQRAPARARPTLFNDSAGAPRGLDADMGVNGTAYARVRRRAGRRRPRRAPVQGAFASARRSTSIPAATRRRAARGGRRRRQRARRLGRGRGRASRGELPGHGDSRAFPQEGSLPSRRRRRRGRLARHRHRGRRVFAWVVFRQDLGGGVAGGGAAASSARLRAAGADGSGRRRRGAGGRPSTVAGRARSSCRGRRGVLATSASRRLRAAIAARRDGRRGAATVRGLRHPRRGAGVAATARSGRFAARARPVRARRPTLSRPEFGPVVPAASRSRATGAATRCWRWLQERRRRAPVAARAGTGRRGAVSCCSAGQIAGRT